MNKLIKTSLFTLLLNGLSEQRLAAQANESFCSTEFIFQGCDSSTLRTAQNSGYRCLQKMVGCGRYEYVLTQLEGNIPTLNPFQNYYAGVSHYALSSESSALSDRCSHIQTAKTQISLFLNSALTEFNTAGTFVSYNIAHISHATKVLKDLEREPGCAVQGLNREQIRILAESMGNEYVKSMFFAAKKDCLTLSTDKGSEYIAKVTCNMQDIITMASDIETGIALRKVELQALKVHLDGDPTKSTPGIISDVSEISGKIAGLELIAGELSTKSSRLKAIFLEKIARLNFNPDLLTELAKENFAFLDDLKSVIPKELALFTTFTGQGESIKGKVDSILLSFGIKNVKEGTPSSFQTDQSIIQSNLQQIESSWRTGANPSNGPNRCAEEFQDNWYCKINQGPGGSP